MLEFRIIWNITEGKSNRYARPNTIVQLKKIQIQKRIQFCNENVNKPYFNTHFNFL